MASSSVTKRSSAECVGENAVHFFGHGVVKTAEPSFDMGTEMPSSCGE